MTLIDIDWTAVLIVVGSGVGMTMAVRAVGWHSAYRGRCKAETAMQARPDTKSLS